MEFLAFADLRPRPGTSPAEWERLTRQAGIVGGAREWRVRLDRLGRRLEPGPSPGEDEDVGRTAAMARDRDALAALRRVARAMLRGLERLPDPGPLGALVDSLTRTFAPPRAAVVGGAAGARRPRPAARAVRRWTRTCRSRSSGRFSRRRCRPRPPARASRRRGACSWASSGRRSGIDFPLTIVPGLVEGGFPAAPRQDPILLDEERRRLTGLPLAEEARALERVRFALAVGSGARRVVLTYPRVDAESGRPRVPSFLVLDLLEPR